MYFLWLNQYRGRAVPVLDYISPGALCLNLFSAENTKLWWVAAQRLLFICVTAGKKYNTITGKLCNMDIRRVTTAQNCTEANPVLQKGSWITFAERQTSGMCPMEMHDNEKQNNQTVGWSLYGNFPPVLFSQREIAPCKFTRIL